MHTNTSDIIATDYNNITNKLDYDNIFQEIVNRLNKVPIMKH